MSRSFWDFQKILSKIRIQKTAADSEQKRIDSNGGTTPVVEKKEEEAQGSDQVQSAVVPEKNAVTTNENSVTQGDLPEKSQKWMVSKRYEYSDCFMHA